MSPAAASQSATLEQVPFDTLNPFDCVIYVPVHYDFSQLEYVAPFLQRFPGSKVFVYKWIGLRDPVRQHYLGDEYQSMNLGVYDFTLENLVSCVLNEDRGKKVVFLLTSSTAYAFGEYQREFLNILKEEMPDRIWGITTVGHCMYGCASCQGNSHKVPVYFTRYFQDKLPYTAETIKKQYLSMDDDKAVKPIPVLVAPSTGETTMIIHREMLEYMFELQKQGKFRWVFKLHPACFNEADYDVNYPPSKAEYENVRFIKENFVVTSQQQPCLLPFIEAFDVILCDLHSSVGFIASYFAPRTIFAYHNDAHYGTPDRDPEFLAAMNIFDDFAGMQKFFDSPMPKPRGDRNFFIKIYGVVDGNEVERFAKLADWPRKSQSVPQTRPRDWRKLLTKICKRWKSVLDSSIERQKNRPPEADEDYDQECRNALGLFAHVAIRPDNPLNGKLPIAPPNATASNKVDLSILSFNLWHAGEAHPAHHSLEKSAQLILSSGADIVGLQEVSGLPQGQPPERPNRIQELAYMLSKISGQTWYGMNQGILTPGKGNILPWGVVTKYPVVKESPSKFGFQLKVPNCENDVWIFNTHLPYFPYQPYQLSHIPYEETPFLQNEKEAIDSCVTYRTPQVQQLINDIKAVESQGGKSVIFLTGDFNEPSHIDWNTESLISGAHPVACEWPCTLNVVKQLNLCDLYRLKYPDVLLKPGFTWTPRKLSDCDVKKGLTLETLKPTEHHDRIDFVMMKVSEGNQTKVQVHDVLVIGPKQLPTRDEADEGSVDWGIAKTVEDYPSDHCAVIAKVSLML